MASQDDAAAARADPARELADAVRAAGGAPTRAAVLGDTRVEFVRGKDLLAFLAAHPEAAARATPGAASGGDRPPAERAAELLLRRGLLARCERRYPAPPAGQARLLKFPRKLVRAAPEAQYVFAASAFYAFTYDRPTSPAVVAASAAAALGVVALCLFPLAPYWAKAAALYAAAGLLTLIVAVLLVRALVAAASWVATGWTVWLLPNLLSEEAGLADLFRPAVAVAAPAPGGWARGVPARAAVGAALGGLLWLLATRAPPGGVVKEQAGRYRDEIFEMLNVRRQAIGAGGAGGAGGAAGDGAAPPPPAAAGGEPAAAKPAGGGAAPPGEAAAAEGEAAGEAAGGDGRDEL